MRGYVGMWIGGRVLECGRARERVKAILFEGGSLKNGYVVGKCIAEGKTTR